MSLWERRKGFSREDWTSGRCKSVWAALRGDIRRLWWSFLMGKYEGVPVFCYQLNIYCEISLSLCQKALTIQLQSRSLNSEWSKITSKHKYLKKKKKPAGRLCLSFCKTTPTPLYQLYQLVRKGLNEWEWHMNHKNGCEQPVSSRIYDVYILAETTSHTSNAILCLITYWKQIYLRKLCCKPCTLGLTWSCYNIITYVIVALGPTGMQQ